MNESRGSWALAAIGAALIVGGYAAAGRPPVPVESTGTNEVHVDDGTLRLCHPNLCDGARVLNQSLPAGRRVFDFAPAPGSNLVAFMSDATGDPIRWRIYALDRVVGGASQRRLSPADTSITREWAVTDLALSPDARRVVYRWVHAGITGHALYSIGTSPPSAPVRLSAGESSWIVLSGYGVDCSSSWVRYDLDDRTTIRRLFVPIAGGASVGTEPVGLRWAGCAAAPSLIFRDGFEGGGTEEWE